MIIVFVSCAPGDNDNDNTFIDYKYGSQNKNA